MTRWRPISPRTWSAAILGAGLAGVVLTRTWPIAVLILLLGAVVASTPTVGSRFLAAIRWRALPLVGRTTGLAAAGIILLSSVGLGVIGAAVAPLPISTPNPAASPTATLTTTASTAAPSIGSLSPAAQPTIEPPQPPTPTPTPFSFGSGRKLVGTDIRAAAYRMRSASPGCHWERLSGLGGTPGEVIASGMPAGPEIVTIIPTDTAFTSSGCAPWSLDLSPVTKAPTDPFGAGTFIVGVDIAPGTWRSSQGAGCSWQRLKGFGGTPAEIISNENASGPTMVTISEGDKGFSSTRCGTWTKVG